jgi:urocanate hydratase
VFVFSKAASVDELITRVSKALENKETVSIGYLGNVVDI